jgi:2',3'-cyclic-nucleotide 2'-phosphodiesterase (5'-nucleotidase family)
VFAIAGNAQEVKHDTITLVYTASLNGHLDGCNCEASPKAGLVKMAYFLDTINDSGAIVLVDGGDLFDYYPDKVLSSFILEAYERVDYDVINIGEREFVNGIPTLIEYKQSYPFFSNNIAFSSRPDEEEEASPQSFWGIFQGPPVPDSPLIITRSGVRVGVLAVTEKGILAEMNVVESDTVTVFDPVEAARSASREVRDAGVDIVILLYHGYYQEARTLVEEVSGIDVVVVAHEGRRIYGERKGDAIFVSPGKYGNVAGVLKIQLSGEQKLIFENRFESLFYGSDPDHPFVRKLIEEYRQELQSQIKVK